MLYFHCNTGNTFIQTDPKFCSYEKERNVFTGNMYTYKYYASPSDKTGPKNETVHLALNPWQAASL